MPTDPLSDDALLALADAATEGPWTVEMETRLERVGDMYDMVGGYDEIDIGERLAGADGEPLDMRDEHVLAFIAAAREAIPRLVAEKRALHNRLLDVCQHHAEHDDCGKCATIAEVESTNG